MDPFQKAFFFLFALFLFHAPTDKLSAQGVQGHPKLNVLFLLSDDQRANTIHALGNQEIITPTLDELSREGTSFLNSYIMGGSQGAVCVPSRAMIMTGRYVYKLNETGTVIPDDQILLGEQLQKYGYQTFGIGKWHNGSASYARNFSAGSDIFFGGMTDQFHVKVWDYDPSGQYKNDTLHHQPHINQDKHSSELFADAAIDFLQRYDGQKPFFLYVAFTSPHDPRSVEKRYYDLYDTAKIALPKNFIAQHPFDNGELKVRDELLASFPRTPQEIKQHIRDYYAMITHLDEQVGRIIKALKASGQYDHTIIVFAGDNGLALGQHGLMGKQNVYEHSIKVPLIFVGPGIPKNQKTYSFAYLLDIYPTLCDKLNIAIPSSVDGKSLTGIFKNPQEQVHETLYFRYRDFQRAVRNQSFKLIEYNVNGKRTSQLFASFQTPMKRKTFITLQAIDRNLNYYMLNC